MLGMFHADISRTQPPESCAHLVPAHATRPRQRNRPRTDSPKPASESHIDAQPASSSGARLGALPLRPSPPLVPMTALALVCATLADGGDDLPRTCTTPRQSVAANARGAGRSARTSSPPRSSSTPLVDHATRVASTCHTHDAWTMEAPRWPDVRNRTTAASGARPLRARQRVSSEARAAAASKATGPPNGSIGSLRRKKRGRAQRLARCGLTGGRDGDAADHQQRAELPPTHTRRTEAVRGDGEVVRGEEGRGEERRREETRGEKTKTRGDEHRMRAEQRRLDTGPQVRSSQARRHANVKPSQAKPSQAKPRPVRAVRPSPPVAGTAAAHPSGANDGSTLEKAAGCGSSAPATYAPPSSSWLGSEWMFHECDGRRCRPGSCACPAPRAPPQARARTRRCRRRRAARPRQGGGCCPQRAAVRRGGGRRRAEPP